MLYNIFKNENNSKHNLGALWDIFEGAGYNI